ncbi:unnamed protein product [Calypogeia fissa]
MAPLRTLFLAAACSVLILAHFAASVPLNASQIFGLQQLQQVLEKPPILNGWYTWTDFCNLPPTPDLKLVCQGNVLTELRIVGDKPSPSAVQNVNQTDGARLSPEFSSSALADALMLLPNLTVLELVALGMWGPLPPKLNKLGNLQVLNFSSNFYSGSVPEYIANLTSIQVVDFDDNQLNGSFPQWMGTLPNLTSLILSRNFFTGTLQGFEDSTFPSLEVLQLDSNLFNGSLPKGLSTLGNLTTLSLAQNQFTGAVPDFSNLQQLQTLNLNGNFLGPKFPSLGSQVVILQLARNNFLGSIPDSIRSLTQLQQLDVSYNSLNGFPPLFLYTLPNITTLDFSENHFSGQFGSDFTLARSLVSLDISSNYFTGQLPKSFNSSSRGRNVDYENNCFEISTPKQQPESYCMYESQLYSTKKRNVALIAGLVGGGVGVFLSLFAVVFVFCCRCQRKHRARSAHVTDYATSSQAGSSVAIPSELLSNARYLSQSMRLGVLTVPQHQVFSLEQLEEATDNFSRGSLIGEGIRGKVYKGRLEDGTNVAVKCCCFDPKLDSNDVRAQMDSLSKLRHHNVVSVIGYCLVESETNNKHDRRLFVVSEYVANGHLRSHISEGEERMNWLRRLAALIGAAKGVHYLHHGVLPSIFHHDLKMTNILLDHNFVPKICDFGLPKPPSHVRALQGNHVRRSHYRRRYADKMDIYNFGLILLEMVLGRPPTIEKNLGEGPKVVEVARLTADQSPNMDLIDPVLVGDCEGESLSTVIDIGIKCLSDDMGARPSMEDVLWNLQYAVQVHDTSLADADEMFDYCSSPGSTKTRKDQKRKKSGSFETSVLFEKQLSGGADHERKNSVDDPLSPRFNSDFFR